MKSAPYILGFFCGLAIVLMISVILRIKFKNKKGYEYDERQEAIRGTGFKYAYFTAMLIAVIGGIVETMADKSWCSLFPFAMICLWASLCVFITYCVIKDAYFTLRSKRNLLIAIFFMAAAINLYFGIESIISGEIIVGGALGLNATNLITGASCLYLGAMMLLHSIHERRQEDAE